MMLQQPMTCSMPTQNKMAPPLSAMAFRDATTTVMSNMAQQQPPMTNSDVNKIPDVNKMPTSTDDHTPDVNKMPTSTDDHVPEASNHHYYLK